ncbi:ABC transporter ATP-binding protein [Aquimarina sp. W85]|uniref:ABC transporter ATP-binding protein n=1 Tax=Aquimarina rhodophyticola TaxID=3342246 RepID=UPI0036717520
MGTPIVHIKEVTKYYQGADFKSLDTINLEIYKNEIFGLLGPNGAGKTTLLSIVCGLLTPSSGTISINGTPLSVHTKSFKSFIGVVPQEYALYPSLTAKENLWYFGSMYGLSKNDLKLRIESQLETMGLMAFANKKVKTFSGGMKRRINLIAGILHNPKLLFLDEPTVGVDVQSKQVITQQLKSLNADGTTIIYTSHHLREAQELCTRVGIIDMGKIIADNTPTNLIASTHEARNLEDVFITLTGKELRDYA